MSTIHLHIPDMSCGHCEASVKAALAPLASAVSVDLPARKVAVQGAAEAQAVLAALQQVGFPAQVIAQNV